jgi:hypothetical protein
MKLSCRFCNENIRPLINSQSMYFSDSFQTEEYCLKIVNNFTTIPELLLNIGVEWLALVPSVRELPGSNLGYQTCYSHFSQPLRTNVVIFP